MKIFTLSPCYLGTSGAGINERKIVKHLSITDQLFITSINVITNNSNKFSGEIINNSRGKTIVLPTIKPVILSDFFYGLIFSLIFTFYKLLGKKPFDILYIRDLPVSICFGLFRKCHGTPIVVKFVNFVADELLPCPKNTSSEIAKWIVNTIEKIAILKSDRVLVPSELFKKELISRYGIPKNKVSILSSGVDVSEFSTANYNKTNPVYTVGYFGSLGVLHDIDCLFKALQLLKSKIRIKLVLSTQSDTTRLMRMIDLYNLKEVVDVLNTPHNLIPMLMRTVDLIVIPRCKVSSTDLVLPLKLWEAGAAKKPVIISRSSIVEHELENMKHIIMYEPGDFEELAAKLLQLHDDESLRKTIGEALSEHVETRDWKVITSNLRKIFAQLVTS